MIGITDSLRRKNTRPQVLALALIGAGLVVLGVATLVLLSKAARGSEGDLSAVPVEVNFPAPELSLLSLEGETVSLSDYRGLWVLVNNWATWCPPCKEEMPALNAFYTAHRSQNFILIAIEAGEPADEVARFVRYYGLSFPIWLDARQEALAAFNNLALPSSYLVDPEGAVRLAWSGAISLKMLEKNITPLLER